MRNRGLIWNKRNAALNDVTLDNLDLQDNDRVLDVGFGELHFLLVGSCSWAGGNLSHLAGKWPAGFDLHLPPGPGGQGLCPIWTTVI